MKKLSFVFLIITGLLLGCSSIQPINNPSIDNTIANLDGMLDDLKDDPSDTAEEKYQKKYQRTVVERTKADLLTLKADNANLTKQKDKSDKIAQKNSNKAAIIDFLIYTGIFIGVMFLLFVVYKVVKKLSLFGL